MLLNMFFKVSIKIIVNKGIFYFSLITKKRLEKN